MSDDGKHFRPGQILACPECHEVGPLQEPIDLDEGETVQLKCSSCLRVFSFGDRPTPKFPPTQKTKTSFATVELAASQEANERRVRTDNNLLDEGAEPIQQSFQSQAEDIADTLYSGLQKINVLKDGLDELSRAMVFQFEEAWSQSELIKQWDAGHLKEFIERPFMQFPVETDDQSIDDFCTYIVAPKFFEPRFGIPIPCNGGFRLELMTPYTRFSGYSVSQWLADYLGIPQPLELEVYGSKIVGQSLIKCWASIPGVEPDDDHKNETPSIRIVEQALARQWLAKNGIQPWSATSLEQSETYAKGGILKKSASKEKFYWDIVKEYGRVLFNWYDSDAALALCLKIATMFHGHKLFLSDAEGIERWRNPNDKVGGVDARGQGFMWHSWSDIDNSRLDQVPVIFVFCHEGDFPVESLESLYKYNGSLVIVHDNPVGDVLGANEESLILNSLVARVITDNPLYSWRRNNLPEGNRVAESLRRLQKQ